jgi:hypothetical protein
MTFGYLVLVAFGLIEWRLLGTRDLPRAGLAQMLALFLGGIVISVGLLVGAEQAAGGIYLLTQLVAVVLFVVRVWPRSLRVGWLTQIRSATRSGIDLGRRRAVLFMYIVFAFITAANPDDPALRCVLIAAPFGLHRRITNVVLSLLALLVLDETARRSWIGHVVFWGVNLGLLVFVIGLIVDTPEIKRIGAPVMGLTLYAALAILAYRALSATLESAESDLADAG